MRKYLFLIMFCLIFSLIGCSSQTASNNKKTSNNKTREVKQTVQNKVKNNPKKYNIDKIIIPSQGDTLPDVQIYQDFSNAVVTEMAKENNIPVEIKNFPTYNDMEIALQRGDINVIPGIVQTYSNPDFILTYTYFTGAIYRLNGEELDSEKSYSMVVRKTDKELYNFFNDMISKFNDTGKLKRIEKEYLGERNKIN